MSFVYDIRLNHVGYPCKAKKTFVYMGPPAEEYEIKRLSLCAIHDYCKGKLKPFGDNDTVTGKPSLIGDFSEVTEPGIYKIKIGNKFSRTFYIYDEVYNAVCRTLTQYYEWQRCGDDCGYNPNCHLGDEIVDKNGKVHHLAGGHHQSGDLRKWAFGAPNGIFCLAEYAREYNPLWSKGRLEYEVRHSVKHYLPRISPDGYVFDSTFVPTYYNDKECHGKGYPSETAFWDDFLYFDTPTDHHGNCNVARLLVSAYKLFKNDDPIYADKCLAGARKIHDWMDKFGQFINSHTWKINPPLGHDNFKEMLFDYCFENSAPLLADLAYTDVEFFRATGDDLYKAKAIERLKRLAALQIRDQDGAHAGFKLIEGSDKFGEEIKYFWINFPLPFVKALDSFGECEERAFLLDMVTSLVKFYEKQASTNAFEKISTKIIDFKGKKSWDYHAPSYVSDLADTALFLTIASRYCDRDLCLGIAQRQLDFIVGANHGDISHIEGVGFNQLPFAITSEFFPPIPKIPGAVITEIYKTDPQDDLDGREYDMPIVGSVLLAFATYQNEISK